MDVADNIVPLIIFIELRLRLNVNHAAECCYILGAFHSCSGDDSDPLPELIINAKPDYLLIKRDSGAMNSSLYL